MELCNIIIRNKKTGLTVTIPSAEVTMAVDAGIRKIISDKGIPVHQIGDPIFTFTCKSIEVTQPINAKSSKKELFIYRFWKWFYHRGAK